MVSNCPGDGVEGIRQPVDGNALDGSIRFQLPSVLGFGLGRLVACTYVVLFTEVKPRPSYSLQLVVGGMRSSWQSRRGEAADAE